jgi:hypothetical protein
VDRGTTGEVEHAPVLDPAAAPHPEGDGGVDHDDPHGGEDDPGEELHPVGDGAGDQGDGDDGEHHAEGGDGPVGDAAGDTGEVLHVVKAERAVEVAEEGVVVGAEVLGIGAADRDGLADEDPGDGHDANGHQALHHHVEDARGPGQTAVEQRETGRHEQNKGGGGQDPGIAAAVELGHGRLLSPE